VTWAIGTTPGGSDVKDWEDVGHGQVLAARSTEPIILTASGLALEHKGTYWVTIATANTAQIIGSFTAAVPVYLDLTPPECREVRAFKDAAGIKYWGFHDRLFPGWSFRDNETSVLEMSWYLADADGNSVMETEYVGSLESSFAYVGMEHNTRYCVHAAARNYAGSWSDPTGPDAMVGCFLVDVTAPIFARALLLDARLSWDGWLLQLAAADNAGLRVKLGDASLAATLPPMSVPPAA
jgi:hypothetical protein